MRVSSVTTARTRPWQARLLLGAALVAAGLGTARADEATEWLMRINQAGRERNYDGVFVYLHGNQMEAMRIVHQAQGGELSERLYSLNGEAREVIRDAREIWCYLPGRKLGVRELRKASDRSFPAFLPDTERMLQHTYSVELGPRDRIADRSARVLVVMPRDQYRYGYQLWADESTALLLKANLIDERGEPLEQYMFTHVTIGEPIAPEALAPRTPRSDLVWHGEKAADGEQAPKKGVWFVEPLPAGYRPAGDVLRRPPSKSGYVRHLVFSDGIATVSVFIERRAGGEPPMEGLSHMGAVHAFGRVLDGDWQVTVVGEVPAATVREIAAAVRRGGG